MAAFLKEAMRYVAFLMRQVSAQLLYSISHASFVVDADVESILTILGQLLSNAIRYRYKGTPVEVRVHFTEFHGKSMGVDIVNWGHDIPEEICPHICEPYYIYDHGDGARGGNGLGFTVVDQLVGALMGALYFHSENGETLFHFGYLFDDTRTGVQKLPRWEVGGMENAALRHAVRRAAGGGTIAYITMEAKISINKPNCGRGRRFCNRF